MRLQVTGEPRFGPSTAAKIQSLLALHADLCTRAEPLAVAAKGRQRTRQEEAQNRLEEEEEDKAAAERIQQLRVYTNHPAPPPMVPLNIFRPDLLPAKTTTTTTGEKGQESRLQEESEEEKEAKRLLREKAENLRTQKRTQAELESLARCQVYAEPRYNLYIPPCTYTSRQISRVLDIVPNISSLHCSFCRLGMIIFNCLML